MTSYTELTEKATSSVLNAVKPVEELAVKVAGALGNVTDKLPSLPLPSVLPTPAEAVAANFAVAERLLAAQKDFALRLVAGSQEPTVTVPHQWTETTVPAGATS